MVFNKDDKTLTQLKSERRKLNEIISTSFKRRKHRISQNDVICDNQRVIGQELNGLTDREMDCIHIRSELNINDNQSLTNDYQKPFKGYIDKLSNSMSSSIESKFEIEDSDKPSMNSSHNMNTSNISVDNIESSSYGQNSCSLENMPQNNVILDINSHNKEIDPNINSFDQKNEMTKQNNNISNIEERDPKLKKLDRFRTLKGIALAFISAIFFSITTVIVKYVNDVHPGEMAFFRFFGILLFTIPLLMEWRANPFGPPHLRHWLILRGLAGASSLYLRYCALHYMSIADATVIVLSMPVFVCVFARVCLKESCGVFHVIALVVTLIGIAFTSKLAIIFGSNEDDIKKSGIDSQKELLGLLCSLGATVIGSSAYVIVRKIKGLHYSVILFNFSWVAIVETSIITYALDGFKLPNCGIAQWLLCLLAIFSFYGQMLLTKALQAEEAGLVSVTRASSEVIFAFIFQITIFRDMPDGWSILGAILVTSSVLLTSSRKWVLTLPIESKVRKALNFVTK